MLNRIYAGTTVRVGCAERLYLTVSPYSAESADCVASFSPFRKLHHTRMTVYTMKTARITKTVICCAPVSPEVLAFGRAKVPLPGLYVCRRSPTKLVAMRFIHVLSTRLVLG